MYERLVEGVATAAASWAREEVNEKGGYVPGTPIPAGEDLGSVLVWLWRNDPGTAMRLVAAYLGDLRQEGNDSLRAGVTLDDVLSGHLQRVMPTFSDEERAEFEDRALREAPPVTVADPRGQDARTRRPIHRSWPRSHAMASATSWSR